MITIDQLPGDVLHRYYDEFGKAGFRYLIDNGIVYRNANYLHSTTFTAVGHSTLATGGNPNNHGIVGNVWHDYKSGLPVYCVEDESFPDLDTPLENASGHSPVNLLSSTFGDELIMSSGLKSRVFSVSTKDRGAILPGGHLGKSFWFSTDSGNFVTSKYYYQQYPNWVEKWNELDNAETWRNRTWSLLRDKKKYRFGDGDHRSFERPPLGINTTFPHAFDQVPGNQLYSALRFTPIADLLTLDFVKVLLVSERIGQGDYTDMLFISFSSTDFIGHAFGPNSLEAEDNLLRLDQTIEELLSHVDRFIGLDNTLVILSSDHGTDAAPEFRQKIGFMGSGRLDPEHIVREANDWLKVEFNTNQDIIISFWNPSIYLDLKLLDELKINVGLVETALAAYIESLPGVSHAITRTDLLHGNITNTPTLNRVQRSFHPERSGNVILVQEQFWHLYHETDLYAAMHGSPFNYDTHVPLIFAGHEILHQTVNRPVSPEDIATTVSSYLNIPTPSGSVGQVLEEVVDSR